MDEPTVKLQTGGPALKQTAQPLFEQAGAICYRRISREVLLITSRRSGRWGIPKGNIEAGETTAQAAEREAFEEAGIRGTCAPEILGAFAYRKEGASASYRVSVHLLDVRLAVTEFPEKGQRIMRWVPFPEAIEAVHQPGLKMLLGVLGKTSLFGENS
ncbi:NUDIX hydrolase [Rhizobium tumorigenes]|uniref:NUDIX hydrolase n=1 Tax=Rhizobium tumorigenes TaxID=2041385 RepID=A0AAF1K2J1_9HYPH|nr:NUDIX hydrolase [Rhizobium tumorigenes]WFR94348.1 NUDIX hydrolase [Rhizobium tumorigenes]